MGGGHRGDAALAKLAPGALREIAIGTGFGVFGALAWAQIARSNKAEWAVINKDYQAREAVERKQFLSWLSTQKYDDES